MNSKISIIVPVFNTEKYIERCIENIINQTVRPYELILIDDGSTDNSGAICDYYAKNYEYVHVFHKKENEGLALARNTGIEIAEGEWLSFIDSDDWVVSNYLEILDNYINIEDPDIIAYHIAQTNKENYQKNFILPKMVEIFDKEQTIEAYLNGLIDTTACSKIFRKRVFDRQRFENVPLYEDAYVMHLLLAESRKTVYIDELLYIQYVRRSSLARASFGEKNFISIECGERLLEYIDSRYPQFHELAVVKLIQRQYSVLQKMIFDKCRCKYSNRFVETYSDMVSNFNSLSRQMIEKSVLLKKIEVYSKSKILFAIAISIEKIVYMHNMRKSFREQDTK